MQRNGDQNANARWRRILAYHTRKGTAVRMLMRSRCQFRLNVRASETGIVLTASSIA